MRTKQFILAICGAVAITCTLLAVYTEIQNRQHTISNLTKKNLSALASGDIDGGSGLLWKKHWVYCPIGGGKSSLLAAHHLFLLALMHTTLHY